MFKGRVYTREGGCGVMCLDSPLLDHTCHSPFQNTDICSKQVPTHTCPAIAHLGFMSSLPILHVEQIYTPMPCDLCHVPLPELIRCTYQYTR